MLRCFWKCFNNVHHNKFKGFGCWNELKLALTKGKEHYHRSPVCPRCCVCQSLVAGFHPRVGSYLQRLWRVAIMAQRVNV